jgi:hypothetical protein
MTAPVKYLISVVTGLEPHEFNSVEARNKLSQMGVEIISPKTKKKNISEKS